MRWFLMSSPILRGGNLIVTEQGIRDSVRQVLIPLWNSWYFFSLYANAAKYTATRRTDSTDPLDRYLLAKLRQYVDAMTHQLDNYEVANACDSTRGFLDVLTNWYIRRSRERFWASDGVVDTGAFDTLYTVLETVCRVAAPLLPLTTEEIWRGLTGERSVHLTDWPEASAPCRPTRSWLRPWTWCATCARRRRRCGRPPACATGCRCRSSRSWSRTLTRSTGSCRSCPTRST